LPFKFRVIHIIATLIIVVFSLALTAQADVSKNIQELHSIWNKHDSTYSYNHLEGSSSDALGLLEQGGGTANFTSLNLNSEIRTLESEMLEKDWGLQWKSGGQVYSLPGLEVADNLVYRSRLKSEISWGILNNGYFDNQYKSQIRLNEAKILSL
jgi:hypothetical protein